MNKVILMMISALLIVSPAALGLAGESGDHVCFRVLDTNRDGVVTLPEFEAHYGQNEEAFSAADANQDGHLTHAEYHASLGHGSPS